MLRFDPAACTLRTLEGVTFRAWEGLRYCTHPMDDVQRLNLYAPVDAAPDATIFMPNTVGGYMPGPAATPEHPTVLAALRHGYVVACAGIRGHASREESGRFTGRAPAFVVDMKAAIRYLRYNREVIPGNTERIVTNGTSAGGALSALTGASGNSPDYAPWLEAIGAADERDDIFAASCYCPIINLENADAAYEWQFLGVNNYHRMRWLPGGSVPDDGQLTDSEIIHSAQLARLFPAYVNGLGLRTPEGAPLTLDEHGNGSFKEWVKAAVVASAQHQLEKQPAYPHAVHGSDVAQQTCLRIENGRVASLDWGGFVRAINRMKSAPAFDGLSLSTPENAVFGDEDGMNRHFTAYARSVTGGETAPASLVRLMNPMTFIGKADTAPHWRIRHGAFDRDTSLAIPVMLATLLENHGKDVDFHLPWGLPHSGDYDLNDLFSWIDRL